MSRVRGSLQTPHFQISKIMTDSCGNNTVYLFDSKDGFVVTPADDAFPALLGYGDSQIYDSADNLPIGFSEWLQYMSRCISEAAIDENKFTVGYSIGEAIAPLCMTSWGQGEPFNLECPEYNGERCLSGCVATAMAQVMKYHNWPPQGKGELTYRAEKIGTDIYTNFSQYTLDWENMLYDYSATSANEQQRQAVAHLLRGLGGSVCMNYFPTASGADINDATQALLKYWDYSDDIRYIRRSWFTLRDWSQLLYDALKNYGPILYGGFSSSSAHAFVCDGYDGEGLFHFNWGWDGKADGYFAIDFLNPVVEDEPWKTGYNGSQSALLNIHPRSPENPGIRSYAVWLDSYYINPATQYGDETPHTLHPGDSFKMKGECVNYGPFVIPAGSKFATLFTPFYDGATVPSNIVELKSDLKIYGSFDSEMKIIPKGLSDGLYLLENDFYISPSGWGQGILMPGSVQYCALVKNNGSDIRFIESVFPPKIEVADFPDQLDLNSSNVFHATICNSIPRKLERHVRIELIQDGTVKGWSPWVNASWEPEGKIDLELSVDNWIWKENSNYHLGEYVLCLSIRNTFGDIWIPMGQGKKVTVSDSASIDAVKADDISYDAMYDLYGRRVSDDIHALSSGLYIRLNDGVVSKIVIH
ncbi:MAG: C10 family peptidase [Muribaculaceae bacterium]|nr:C10 family peptidase [uncultured Duncaniella sp.]MCX4264472.1 C10 family peptidase [Muribaculaceae bacterium]